jgi:hypothetical protein
MSAKLLLLPPIVLRSFLFFAHCNSANYSEQKRLQAEQTELVFTFAKNSTKPNPLEIISLQTTRKENNWKTKETLARAAVTGDGTGQRVQSLMFMIMMNM